MRDHVVYLLDWTDRGGKQYIGITKHLEVRLEEHKSGINGSEVVHLSWNKYGKPNIQILHKNLDRISAYELEVKEIKSRNTLSPKGYNLTTGGDGWRYSPETVEKQRQSQLNRYKDPKEREKTSQANRKRYEDFEERKRTGLLSKKYWANVKYNVLDSSHKFYYRNTQTHFATYGAPNFLVIYVSLILFKNKLPCKELLITVKGVIHDNKSQIC